MDILNKTSLFGLLIALMFSLVVTADEIVTIKEQPVHAVASNEKLINPILDKKQLRKRYEQIDRRTTLGKITDKRAYN